MTDKEKNIYGFIAAIAVAIILWLLFRNRKAIKQILQNNGVPFPAINIPGAPTYETPSFPSIETPVNMDGCKMCMNGNYSIIVPAGAPKVVESAPVPETVAKYLAKSSMGSTSSGKKVTPWWYSNPFGR